jgi:signal transduction histidine kinase/ligand-binding sensor domain-containing protein/DNA-binding response OmpR family regulator
MVRSFFLAMLLFANGFVLRGQGYLNWQFKRIDRENGLSHSLVKCIVEDTHGFLWFGTQDGLSRYDGRNIEVYRPRANADHLPDDQDVKMLFRHSSGDIWIAFENGGLSQWDYETGSFLSFSSRGLLTDRNVTVIFEDRNHTIWVGTQRGLNKYDARTGSFVQYLKSGEPADLRDDWITALAEDERGTLIVGTKYGLHFRSKGVEHFRHVVLDPSEKKDKSISTVRNCVTALSIDQNKNLWVGTRGYGLLRFRSGSSAPDLQVFYNPHLANPNHKNGINFIHESRNGELWIGRNLGISRIKNPEEEQFHTKTYLFEQNNFDSFGLVNVTSIAEDPTGKVWVSSNSSPLGIAEFDASSDAFRLHRFEPSNESSPKTNFVNALYRTSQGLLCAGMVKAGVTIVNLRQKKFRHINSRVPGYSLCHDDVYSIFADSSYLLIGTFDGLNVIDLKTKRNKVFRYARGKAGLQAHIVGVIEKDPEGYYWLGYFDGQIESFHPRKGVLRRYLFSPRTAGANLSWSIRSLAIRSEDVIIGACTAGLGFMTKKDGRVHYFMPDTADFTRKGFSRNKTSVNDVYITSIVRSKKYSGRYYLGTRSGGLNMYDSLTGHFTTFTTDPSIDSAISSNHVESLYESENGILWVGTAGGGLCRFNAERGSFFTISEQDGLISNTIHGILADKHGRLWLSTNGGLSCVDPQRNTVHNYNVSDGLQGDEFNEGAYFQSSSGEMFFGGVNGVTVFNPDSIVENVTVPKLTIREMHIFNTPVRPFEKVQGYVPLVKSIENTQGLVLPHYLNDFLFLFSSINYVSSGRVHYSFRLEGHDNAWRTSNEVSPSAAYTNVPPGNYVLRVRCFFAGKAENFTERTIDISIEAPFWMTSWFKLMLSFLFVLTAIAVTRWRVAGLKKQQRILRELVMQRTSELEKNRSSVLLKNQALETQTVLLEEQNKLLQLKNVEIEVMANKVRDSNKAKLDFFTNISHELRTPLTLMIAPLEKLIKLEESSRKINYLTLIQQNCGRLVELVNEILDFQKIDAGLTKLERAPVDVVQLMKSVASSYQDKATDSRISLSIDAEMEAVVCMLDEQKLIKVFSNLLSNALKFTDRGGSVNVTIVVKAENESAVQKKSPLNKVVEITVSDTGIGIPESELELIFNRFHQSHNNTPNGGYGSGLGLAIAKEYVELHEGVIRACNNIKGSSFIVVLPLIEVGVEMSESKKALPLPVVPPSSSGEVGRTKPMKLLMVEDNKDIREYLAEELSDEFEVIQADNGLMAFEIASDVNPDVVLTDIMMPLMDGLSLCTQLKRNEATNHIPVVVLSARASDQWKESGFDAGVDDYITKPFSVGLLRARLRNVVNSREALRRQFSSHLSGNGVVKGSDPAVDFVERARTVVEGAMEDEGFSIDDFAREMMISRTLLYNKLHSYTGKSPAEFIKIVRLNKAALMIREGNLTISEIAFRVGFKDHSHFTRCFKKQFGVSPSALLKG